MTKAKGKTLHNITTYRVMLLANVVEMTPGGWGPDMSHMTRVYDLGIGDRGSSPGSLKNREVAQPLKTM